MTKEKLIDQFYEYTKRYNISIEKLKQNSSLSIVVDREKVNLNIPYSY